MIRFHTVKTRNSVERYSNSTCFLDYPGYTSLPLIHVENRFNTGWSELD